MRVLLVVPTSPSHYTVPPLGLGYLAAAVRRLPGGVDVELLDCVRDRIGPRRFRSELTRRRPDVVGFQMFSSDFHMVRRKLAITREVLPSAVTVAGGAHPSAEPAATLEAFADLDYAMAGEGEDGLAQLVRRLGGDSARELAEIPGLAWRDEGIIRTNPPSYAADLDRFGFPSWDLMDPREYRDAPEGVFLKDTPVAPISTSRGCPFSCTFCASHALMGRVIRRRSVEHVVDEIALLCGDYGVREIHVEDDNFTASKKRVLEFCATVRRRGLRFHLTFPNGVRLDTLDEETVVALRDIGCYSMILGIESGSQRVLDSIEKKLTLDEVRAKVELVTRLGIEARGFFILGLPGETRREMDETIEFARSLELSAAQFSSFVPLPGTRAAAQLASEGRLDALDWDRLFFHRTPYAPDGMTAAELKAMQRRAYLRFYLRPRIVAGLLAEIKSPRHMLAIGRRLADDLFVR